MSNETWLFSFPDGQHNQPGGQLSKKEFCDRRAAPHQTLLKELLSTQLGETLLQLVWDSEIVFDVLFAVLNVSDIGAKEGGKTVVPLRKRLRGSYRGQTL